MWYRNFFLKKTTYLQMALHTKDQDLQRQLMILSSKVELLSLR